MELPDDVKTLCPEPIPSVNDGAEVRPEAPEITSVEVEGGVWRFQSWTPESATVAGKNVEFIGVWLYTPAAPEENGVVTEEEPEKTDETAIPTNPEENGEIAMALSEIFLDPDEAILAEPNDFTLYPGEKVEFTVSYRVQEGDVNLVNVIEVYDASGELIARDTATAIAVIQPVVDLAVEKTRTSADTASVGDTITWDIEITNNGDKDAYGVTVQDNLPGVVLSAATVNVPAGGTVTVTASYVVRETDSGTLYNTVVVSSTDDPDGNRDTDDGTEIEKGESRVSVQKTVSDRYAEVGDVIEYT